MTALTTRRARLQALLLNDDAWPDEIVGFAEFRRDIQSLLASEARLEEALDEVAMIVSYIIVHNVGDQPAENGSPQIVRVTLEDLGALIQKIGKTARDALGDEP